MGTDGLVEQLRKLDQRGLKALTAHYESAIFFDRLETNLSLAALCLSLGATISGGIIAVIQNPPDALRLFAAAAAGLASLLTAARLQLKSGERSERHRQTGHRFSTVRRDVETFIVGVKDGRVQSDQLNARLEAVTEAYGKAGVDAPSLPGHIWARMIKRFGGSAAPPAKTT
jgi:hypothetical protein